MGDMVLPHKPCMAMAAACGHLVDGSLVGLGRVHGNECTEGLCFRSACSRGAVEACESEVGNTSLVDTDSCEDPCVLPLLAAPGDILESREDHIDHQSSGHRSGRRRVHRNGHRCVHRSDLQGVHRSDLRGVHRSGLRSAHRSGLRQVHTPDTARRQFLCCTPGTALIFRGALTGRR